MILKRTIKPGRGRRGKTGEVAKKGEPLTVSQPRMFTIDRTGKKGLHSHIGNVTRPAKPVKGGGKEGG